MNYEFLFWFWMAVAFGVYVRMKLIESELSKLKNEKRWLDMQIDEVEKWCAYDSPEIGFAMLHLKEHKTSTDGFRTKLRNGEFTFDNYKKRYTQE